MPRRSLIYVFTLQSPWSYLGHAALMELVARHRLEVVWKPTSLAQVFPQSGGLPFAQRHPKRRAYRDIELQRWRVARGVPLELRPAYWPLATTLADRCVVALTTLGIVPDEFVRRAFTAVWAENRNLDDADTLMELLAPTGSEPAAILRHAGSDEVAAIYDAHAREALDAGVFGAPTYVLDGEPFWGQDRLPLLEEALRSDRPPFKA